MIPEFAVLCSISVSSVSSWCLHISHCWAATLVWLVPRCVGLCCIVFCFVCFFRFNVFMFVCVFVSLLFCPILFFCGSALRVPAAETRLTVYRRLEINISVDYNICKDACEGEGGGGERKTNKKEHTNL